MFLGGRKFRPYIPTPKGRGFTGVVDKKDRIDTHKHRLKKLLDDTKHRYGAGAYYDEAKGRIIQYWFNKKYLKRVAAKATRKMKDVNNGSLYKKAFDLWWELF